MDKDKAQYSAQNHNTTATLNGNGNDNDSGAVRSKIKGKGSSGESHGLMTADRGHSASASASLPPRPALKKSHKKGVSKNETGVDAVNAVHSNGHGYTFVTKSLNLPVGGGGGPGSREILHGVSKGSGVGDLGLGPDPGRGGPSFLPSSSLLHPQPSIASQRQRRTDGAAAGELPLSSAATPLLTYCTARLQSLCIPHSNLYSVRVQPSIYHGVIKLTSISILYSTLLYSTIPLPPQQG